MRSAVRRALFVAGVLLVTSRPVPAQDGPTPQQGDLVVTHGEGLVKAAPDRGFVTIAAESRARTAPEAQQLNAQAMQAVQAKLKAMRLAADAIRTLSYELRPEFDYNQGKQILRGYVARNTIEVRVDDIGRIGEVVSIAVASGATSVSDIRFDLKDRDGAEREAVAQAVSRARLRAEAIAAAAGRAIDRIVRVDDEGMGGGPPPRPMMMARSGAAEAAETPVQPGELEIRARVALTVRLK